MALEEARRAAEWGEVPVGAVMVRGGELLARAHNMILTRHDPTAHAELLVIQEAARRLESERLVGTTLYTTLEPCAMCVGASLLARVDRVVFGAWDPKGGALGSTLDVIGVGYGNHRFRVTSGLLESAAKKLLQDFFRVRRLKPVRAATPPIR